jgi:hypothetical protein
MKNANEISKTLMPVFNATGCVGHLLRTARGFRACDANDKHIGTFETPALGVAALLERATDAAQVICSPCGPRTWFMGSIQITSY